MKTFYIHQVYSSINDVRDIYKIKARSIKEAKKILKISASCLNLSAQFVRRALDADSSDYEIFDEKEQKKFDKL